MTVDGAFETASFFVIQFKIEFKIFCFLFIDLVLIILICIKLENIKYPTNIIMYIGFI